MSLSKSNIANWDLRKRTRWGQNMNPNKQKSNSVRLSTEEEQQRTSATKLDQEGVYQGYQGGLGKEYLGGVCQEYQGGEEKVLEKAAVAVDKVENLFKVLQNLRNNNIQYKTTIHAITTTFVLIQGDHQWGLQLTDILIDCGRDSQQARELRGVCLRCLHLVSRC